MASSSSSSYLYRSVTDDYRPSAVENLAALVHKALRDGEYALLPDLVGFSSSRDASSILWKKNSSGWTAVHYAASHFLPLEWWQWILQKATTAIPAATCSSSTTANPFTDLRNDLGETVFDVFFHSYLSPLPWQSFAIKSRSKLFVKALQQVLKDHCLIERVKARFLRLRNYYGIDTTTTSRSPAAPAVEASPDSLAVQRCAAFLQHLHLLCQAATHAEAAGTAAAAEMQDDASSSYSIHPVPLLDSMVLFLAKTGSCPNLIARLALAMQKRDESSSSFHQLSTMIVPVNNKVMEDDLLLPLHAWARAKYIPHYHPHHSNNNNKKNKNKNHGDGMLVPLLEELDSNAANIPDAEGRFPLHLALESGKLWSDFQPLLEAAPHILQKRDVHTQLPAVALAALASPSVFAAASFYSPIVYMRARQRCVGKNGLILLWNLMRPHQRRQALDHAALELDCLYLTNIYQVLRAHPMAVTNSGDHTTTTCG